LPELYHKLIMTGIRRSSLALRFSLDACKQFLYLVGKYDQSKG
jgi:hypothetical protein